MDDDLKRLKARRAGHRSVATRLLKHIDLESVPSASDSKKLEAVLDDLHHQRDQVKKLDEEIQSSLPLDEIEDDVVDSAEYHSELNQTISRLRSLITPSQCTLAPRGAAPFGGAFALRPQVKLPKLDLPCFSGDATAWLTFYGQFKSMIHDNGHLSPIDKFNYLLACLRGEAKGAISGLTVSADNYDAAIDILESRFGNKKQVVSAHFDALSRLEAVFSVDIKRCRNLYDRILCQIARCHLWELRWRNMMIFCCRVYYRRFLKRYAY